MSLYECSASVRRWGAGLDSLVPVHTDNSPVTNIQRRCLNNLNLQFLWILWAGNIFSGKRQLSREDNWITLLVGGPGCSSKKLCCTTNGGVGGRAKSDFFMTKGGGGSRHPKFAWHHKSIAPYSLIGELWEWRKVCNGIIGTMSMT